MNTTARAMTMPGKAYPVNVARSIQRRNARRIAGDEESDRNDKQDRPDGGCGA